MYTFASQLERGERAEAALDRVFAVPRGTGGWSTACRYLT
jgi:hypothetical protein